VGAFLGVLLGIGVWLFVIAVAVLIARAIG
jgi:hypothetical protein